MVERATVNRLVVGSSPTVPARAISSAVEHLPYKEIVTGSIPVSPMYKVIDVGTDWIPGKEKLIKDLINLHLKNRVKYRTEKRNVCDASQYTTHIADHLADVLQDNLPGLIFNDKKYDPPWVYVSNKNWTQTYYHHHLPDNPHPSFYHRHLTTVFYLKNPGGALSIKDEVDLMPKEGQFVVFPLHTLHAPLPYHGEEYRIALNVNFFTKNTYSDFLNISNQTG